MAFNLQTGWKLSAFGAPGKVSHLSVVLSNSPTPVCPGIFSSDYSQTGGMSHAQETPPPPFFIINPQVPEQKDH